MTHFGTTFGETWDALRGKASMGKQTLQADRNLPKWKKERYEAGCRLAVSLLLIVSGVVLIVVQRGQSETLGASMISGVLGYWVR